MTNDEPPLTCSRRVMGWLWRGIAAFGVVVAAAVIVLAVRSASTQDTLHLASRSNGDATVGTEWEAVAVSQRGTLRFNLNQTRWHYAASRNPFPGNSGPSLHSGPVDSTSPRIPTAADWAGKKGVHATGFDAFGFGAGHLTSEWTGVSESTWRTHTAVRLPEWLVALAFLVPAAVSLVQARRRAKRVGDSDNMIRIGDSTVAFSIDEQRISQLVSHPAAV